MNKDADNKNNFSMKSFWALITVMFQGALSDNVYKFLVMMLILKIADLHFPDNFAASTAYSGKITSIAEALFILPFILAVTAAGWMGDRFSKSKVTLNLKLLEILVMFMGIFTLGKGNLSGALIVLFLMGFQSALFSPSKYGILPEILPSEKLGWANGILQGGTFLAIILGTVAGPYLFDIYETSLWLPCILLVVLAIIGSLIASIMKKIPAANPHEKFAANPYPMLHLYSKEIFSNVALKWSMFGMIVWWMVGVMLQGSALITANKILNLNNTQTGLALLPIVIGLGAGCFLTGYVSKNRIELGLVPLGAILMFITCLITYFVIPDFDKIRSMSPDNFSQLKIIIPVIMGTVGLVCGFFIVPLQAYFIQNSRIEIRSGVWAVSNVLTSTGMIMGSVLKGIVIGETSSPGLVFLIGGIMMLIAGFVICVRFPMIPLRFITIFFIKAFYRVNIKGLENIPEAGGALITPNHQSYLDAILISSVIERPVRFIIAEDIYKKWYIYPFGKLTNSIPIKGLGSARGLIQSLRAAAEEIKNGGIICIFPEGQITRLGMMLPFRRGFEHIIRKLSEPIIPVAIDGPYNTVFSLKGGKSQFKMMWKEPLKRKMLNVVIGKQMPSVSRYWEVRQQVMDLMVEAYEYRKKEVPPLYRAAIKQLKSHLFAKKIADHSSGKLVPHYKILSAVIALGKKIRLKRYWENEEMVGIMLPPAIGTIAVNLVAVTEGKIPINLNYTASSSVIEQICDITKLNVIITSKAFMEKISVKLPKDKKIIYLEELKNEITRIEKISAVITSFIAPVFIIERILGRYKPASVDDICTIIFSSGSTGTPKGVELTHWNIWANVNSAYQMVNFPPDGKILGILPLFHSFGFTVVLWLPLLVNYSVILHPNPLYGREIGNFVQQYKITHLLATPTILNTYTRRIQPDQFGSLQMVLTGAEKLRASVSEAFRNRFGIQPIEGFGITECSPIVCLNTPDMRKPGIYQKGVYHGTVGHPVPGVTIRIMDLDTGEILPPNKPGMLLIKGHNIMKGYYKLPEKTAEVFKDGWYISGDIAKIDENGFITITDRLSRFSKIGGEMVPHIKIEEALYNIGGFTDTVFAVTGVPDSKKGEKLVVLYSIKESKAKDIADKLQEIGLPTLWTPRWQDFVFVESIPLLGTGKLDLQKIKNIAVSNFAENSL